ncbi:hypothetical protein [Fluoribacter gormanii]|uniref:hypothetical protein n=1 Tax=Fluoribacter gormanii TaxID=464 RepID=UPI0010411918|nr:hypothetical protein [Fluoribacter gormanii]
MAAFSDLCDYWDEDKFKLFYKNYGSGFQQINFYSQYFPILDMNKYEFTKKHFKRITFDRGISFLEQIEEMSPNVPSHKYLAILSKSRELKRLSMKCLNLTSNVDKSLFLIEAGNKGLLPEKYEIFGASVVEGRPGFVGRK